MTRTRDCAKRQDVRRMLPLVRHEDNLVSLLSRCRRLVGSSCSVSLLCTTDTAGRCGVRQLRPPSKPPARASLEILSYHRQITSHLRKQGTLSINHRLHRPQPYWAVHTSAKASSSAPPASHRRLHGLREHSSAADIHLGSRLIGLCLLYRQRMH